MQVQGPINGGGDMTSSLNLLEFTINGILQTKQKANSEPPFESTEKPMALVGFEHRTEPELIKH